jgi:hypothetical protein
MRNPAQWGLLDLRAATAVARGWGAMYKYREPSSAFPALDAGYLGDVLGIVGLRFESSGGSDL